MGNCKVVRLPEIGASLSLFDGTIELISTAFSWNIFQAYNRMFIFEKIKMFSNFEKPQKAQNARAAASP